MTEEAVCPSRTYENIMDAQREKRGLAEQAAADHARDALINEPTVSETQTTRTCRGVQFIRRWFLYTRLKGSG